MQIEYRKLGKSDKAIYRQTRLECLYKFPDNFGSTYEEESQESQLKFEQIIENEEVDSFMVGVFVEEKCIGLCGFSRESRNKTKHRGEIVQMYVNPDFSGQKIGKTLLKKTIELAFQNPEIEQINLSLVANNTKALQTYLNQGFVEYGLVKNCFKQGNQYWDLCLMILNRSLLTPEGGIF
jgi:RimJ/RimL family protein N-acetyltransferase